MLAQLSVNTVALRYVSSPKSITVVTILVVIFVVRLLDGVS